MITLYLLSGSSEEPLICAPQDGIRQLLYACLRGTHDGPGTLNLNPADGASLLKNTQRDGSG